LGCGHKNTFIAAPSASRSFATPSVQPPCGRGDLTGALTLGIRHGLYRIGCRWTLMTLLIVGDVMNRFWIAALAFLMLWKKVIPSGQIIARLAGFAFTVGGG
jgi:predicted metal-binding membrane protein